MHDNDPGLLALVIDDPLAPRVLAAWKALRLSAADLPGSLSKLAMIVHVESHATLRETIERLTLAGLLLDGGISDVGNQWLVAHVGQRLGAKPKKPDTKKAKK